MDWKAIIPELERKLDPAHVRPPSKFGPKGDYIEGWHAIAEANRIFGHGEWSYVIKSLDRDALEKGKNNKGEDQWQAAYTCIVTVSVGGVVREDVGFGSGFAKQVGDAIEGATKEAVTDALKRALRTFGNPFGLALYDKSRANVGVDAPPFDPNAAKTRILAAIANRKSLPDLNDLYRREKDTVDMLSEPGAAEVMAAFKERKAKLTGPDTARQAPPDEEAA
jgi:DNA repair and recombination protein RAD52